MDREAPGVPPTLDDAQVALWLSEPEVAQQAIDDVVAELGPLVPDAELLPMAEHARLEAAATFDPGRGLAYAPWARLFIAFRLWDRLRRDHGGDKATLARVRLATFQFMAHHQRELDVLRSTKDDAKSELSRFSDALLYRGAMSALPPGAIVRGEDDVVHTEGARRAGEAMRKVVEGLRPEQRRLIQECGAYGTAVAEVAREQNRRYKTVLYAYHDALALCGARLGGLLKTREAPEWDPDVSGQVFEEPPPSSGDGG